MTASTEKRSCKRCTYQAPVWVSGYNTDSGFEALTLNHCMTGMCVKSNSHFQPGSAVLIRMGRYTPKASCTCAFEGLPSITLAEVKWCREVSDESFLSYELGVKYFAPDY